MSELISAELAATCAALGFDDGVTYHLAPHCLDVVKDLIKYLKRDDDSHTVRQYLGRAKLLETDLKKILIRHSNKTELWDVLLRLLINLTSPALMIYNEELPAEKTTRSTYEQLVVYLQGYMVALADDQVWSVVGKRLKNILNMDSSERGEQYEMTVERILTLIKNVLQIPSNQNENRADDDATVHDEVLFALHTSGLVDMLLFVASNASEQQYHMQIVEIVALMLREQCPTKLASVGLERSSHDKDRDSAKLLLIREREVRERMERMKKYAGSRHSRFGGTFVVQNMKAIGENQLICHKPYQKIEALEFSQEKVKIRKAKAPIIDSQQERTSALSVRLFLKEFCVEFLNGAYNPVMRYARSCINGGGHSETSYDASPYLWTLRFFMEFNRRYKFQVKYVSETISNEIFYLVQRQLEQYYEMMLTDKKKIPYWSKRLHLAVKAYQELLHTLAAMDTSSDEGVRESSKIIKSNVFYVPEYRETLLSQLIHYDDVKMSRTYLVDLVTTVHVYLKMLRDFCGRSRTMIVGKKKVKRSRARKSAKKGAGGAKGPLPIKSLEDMWDDAAPEISAVMKDGTIPEVVPFDATLETPIDEQKHEAMKKIQLLLRKREFERAVGLLRSARDVWPENDCFGKSDIPLEEEFLALREIFFAPLGTDIDYGNEQQQTGEQEAGVGIDNEEDEEEDEEEQENGYVTLEETNFKFDEFLRRFANVKIVKAMAILLGKFDENSDNVNRYVVKMLHRIAWDCKMYAMIFQASIFRTFQRILDSKSSRHKELKKFAIFIIRKFAEVAATNPKAYMELLFWKSTREATEMVDGYENVPVDDKVSRALWTEAEEDELRTLFMEHQTNKYSHDLVDWLLENIISDKRSRRGIIKKLKEMYLVVNSKSTSNEVQKRLPKEWSEEEIIELTDLWEKVKDDRDPVETIHEALTVKRSKKVIKEKLLETGLAGDRKELRKKRQVRDHPKSSWETQSVSENSNSSESETESRTKKIVKPKKRKQPSIVYSNDQLLELLRDVVNKNMEKELEWFKESLQDVIEDDDREEGNIESIPLVPLSEDSIAAMDAPSFQRLLRAIGIEPPADEQESYWRIPASMTTSTIIERCRLIENVLLPVEDASDSVTIVEDSKNDSADEAKRVRSQDSDSDMPSLKRRRVIVSDDDDNDDLDELVEKNESPEKLDVSSSRRIVSDDDDDDEPVKENEHLQKVVASSTRRFISDDEEDDALAMSH